MEKYERAVALWQSYQISSIADLDRCLDNFRIHFSYHSGKIENSAITYRDTRDIFANGSVSNYTGNPRALFEQQNQKLSHELLKGKFIKGEPLSVELIKEVHLVLTGGTYDERRYIENGERPGKFKKHDYLTGRYEIGVPAASVEVEITELVKEVNGYEGANILKPAAYFHLRFEHIHPFADGNGRVGRTLLNYYLMLKNHPPLIVFEEDKRLYYECLERYDEYEEINPLMEFLKYETEKTWAKPLILAAGLKTKPKGPDAL